MSNEVIDFISESPQNHFMKKTNQYSHIWRHMHILRNANSNDSRLKQKDFSSSLYFLKGKEAVLHT